MIPKYINDWLTIIKDMSTDNTYKLAWGRAILECVHSDTYRESNKTISVSFNDIALCMLKYYWNQMFFFNLKQSPYKDKSPVICQDTQKLIDEYKRIMKTSIPCWFNVGYEELKEHNEELVNKTILHIAKTLHENVSWRFRYVNGAVLNVYELDNENSLVLINKEDAKDIREYSTILSQLLNFKWAQLLEQFNLAPKISSKVKGISRSKLRRSSLTKYKNELVKQFEDGIIKDFYTGDVLSLDEISIDHVIPWSFMYSDDIWNLVITSKSHNSEKSNKIPSKEDIERLKERNDTIEDKVSNHYRLILKEAKANNYLDKFYFDSLM